MMKASDKTETPGVVEFRDSPVLTTNRLFIALRSYGNCDAKGRVVVGIECSSKKLTAPPDKPLVLLAALCEQLIPVMRYASKDAMESDLKAFQAYVANLHCKENSDSGDSKSNQ